MKIAIMSDTLGTLPNIKESFDVFIHCGNFCPRPSSDGLAIATQQHWLETRFSPWLKNIDAEVKIVIPGQSDIAVNFLEAQFEYHIGAMFLKDSQAMVGGLVVHGMPWIPNYYRQKLPAKSAYIARNKMMYEAAIDNIPDETNILLTRIPPQGILDSGSGDKLLRDKVESMKNLKMHCFGFLQSEEAPFENEGVCYANGYLGKPGYIEVNA